MSNFINLNTFNQNDQIKTNENIDEPQIRVATLKDLKASYQYLKFIKKENPNDYTQIKNEILKNSNNVQKIKSKQNQYEFEANINKNIQDNNTFNKNKFQFISENESSIRQFKDIHKSSQQSKMSNSVNLKPRVYQKSDGEYFYPQHMSSIDEDNKFQNSNKLLNRKSTLNLKINQNNHSVSKDFTPNQSQMTFYKSNFKNSSKMLINKDISRTQQNSNNENSLISLKKEVNTNQRQVKGFKLNSKLILEDYSELNNKSPKKQHNLAESRLRALESVDHLLNSRNIEVNQSVNLYQNDQNNAYQNSSQKKYWHVNPHYQKDLTDGKNLFRMNETIPDPEPDDFLENQFMSSDLQNSPVKKIKQDPLEQIKIYKEKQEEIQRQEQDASPKRRFKEKKKESIIKDPMESMKKKLENRLIESKMEKKIDPKIYYSQERFNTLTTMEKKQLYRSEKMILFQGNMCMFSFDRICLYNLEKWDEKLPKIGMHKQEHMVTEAIAQFVQNSNFSYNLQTLFKEQHRIVTATHLNQLAPAGSIPSQQDEIKLEEVRWVLLEIKALNILKLYQIEYFSLLSQMFKFFLKQNMQYVQFNKSEFNDKLLDEKEELKREAFDIEKVQKKSNRLVDSGMDSIVHLNEQMISKFLIDRFYITEIKKWMWQEKLEKHTGISLNQFQKMVTFEDFVHDQDSSVRVENTYYHVGFQWVEQLQNGIKAMNKINENSIPTGVYNIIRLIK